MYYVRVHIGLLLTLSLQLFWGSNSFMKLQLLSCNCPRTAQDQCNLWCNAWYTLTLEKDTILTTCRHSRKIRLQAGPADLTLPHQITYAIYRQPTSCATPVAGNPPVVLHRNNLHLLWYGHPSFQPALQSRGSKQPSSVRRKTEW